MTESDVRTDVIVVGGGVIGVSVALALARRGASVHVIEARDELGLECSFGNAGLIAPSHCIPLAAPGLVRRIPGWLRRGGAVYVKPRPSLELVRFGALLLGSCGKQRMLRGLRTLSALAQISQELVEDLTREGCDFGYERRGVMNVCRTARALEELQSDARLLAAEGLAPEVLTPGEARQVEPCLREAISGAVLWREDGHCDPRRFTEELARMARAAGVRFETGTRVVGFSGRNDGHIGEVRTSLGSRRAQNVVLAAGSWTAQLARLAGTRVPLQPGKGYHIHLKERFPPVTTPMLFQESVFGVTPMSGQLRLAGTMEFVGLDLEVREGSATRLLDEARLYLDGLEDVTSFDEWCGLRPCTPDTLPLIGRSARVGGLYFATGHAMLGLTLAAVTGRAIAELVLDGSTELPVDPLSPVRYGA